MNDASAGRLIAQNAPPQSLLVDDGYPSRDARFIPPPVNPYQKDQHSGQRSVVERYFGKLKTLWKMVGNKYRWKTEWHGIVIRCAVILTNMLIVYERGLNKR
eukprot:394810_1